MVAFSFNPQEVPQAQPREEKKVLPPGEYIFEIRSAEFKTPMSGLADYIGVTYRPISLVDGSSLPFKDPELYEFSDSFAIHHPKASDISRRRLAQMMIAANVSHTITDLLDLVKCKLIIGTSVDSEKDNGKGGMWPEKTISSYYGTRVTKPVSKVTKILEEDRIIF